MAWPQIPPNCFSLVCFRKKQVAPVFTNISAASAAFENRRVKLVANTEILSPAITRWKRARPIRLCRSDTGPDWPVSLRRTLLRWPDFGIVGIGIEVTPSVSHPSHLGQRNARQINAEWQARMLHCRCPCAVPFFFSSPTSQSLTPGSDQENWSLYLISDPNRQSTMSPSDTPYGNPLWCMWPRVTNRPGDGNRARFLWHCNVWPERASWEPYKFLQSL